MLKKIIIMSLIIIFMGGNAGHSNAMITPHESRQAINFINTVVRENGNREYKVAKDEQSKYMSLIQVKREFMRTVKIGRAVVDTKGNLMKILRPTSNGFKVQMKHGNKDIVKNIKLDELNLRKSLFLLQVPRLQKIAQKVLD